MNFAMEKKRRKFPKKFSSYTISAATEVVLRISQTTKNLREITKQMRLVDAVRYNS